MHHPKECKRRVFDPVLFIRLIADPLSLMLWRNSKSPIAQRDGRSRVVNRPAHPTIIGLENAVGWLGLNLRLTGLHFPVPIGIYKNPPFPHCYKLDLSLCAELNGARLRLLARRSC